MNERFMEEALKEARAAFLLNEVPIGAVIIKDEKIIARGHNRTNTEKNPLYHAEIIAINEAVRVIGDFRLIDCVMYVTIEPCPMCAGAIVNSRIPRLFFGAPNAKAGCCGSILNIVNDSRFNHVVDVTSGVMEAECGGIMSEFFSRLRMC